MLLDAFCPFQV